MNAHQDEVRMAVANSEQRHPETERDCVRMPSATGAPLVLAVGIALLAIGVPTNLIFLIAGGVLIACGVGLWIRELLPGRGHWDQPLETVVDHPAPLRPSVAAVAQLRPGVPGYRFQLPEKVHPISAGIKGGLVGGLVMPLPAMAYGVLSGHGIWWPVNLLAGMVVPGVGRLTSAELEEYRPTYLVLGIVIHIVVSLFMGLIYGVLMPTLPEISKPFAWAALLAPLLWTASCYTLMGITHPTVQARIEWPWFVVSQLVFGLVAAGIYVAKVGDSAPPENRGSEALRKIERGPRNIPQTNRGQLNYPSSVAAGLLGGLAGGLVMPVPALLWGIASHHGIWYPANVLAAMVLPTAGERSVLELEQFDAEWLTAALVTHLIFSLAFGLILGAVMPWLPRFSAPLAWGGILMPLLWTAFSYGLMGVVNPVLQEHVHWPWFVAAQFVFGVVAAIVVVRSEKVPAPPAGGGRPPGRVR